jgi:hypothetical protein
MQLFKKLLVFHLILFMSLTACTQKQSFDVLTYTAPKGWQQQQQESSVQLSVSDSKTGAYALALITKATASDAGAAVNFKTDWDKLVKASVQVNDAPAMQEPVTENGWNVISGTANYTDDTQKGVATLLTATGGGQMVSVVLMTNTDKYQNELLTFIRSLQLLKPVSNPVQQNRATVSASGNKSIAGLWNYNILETSGYINGMPQYSAGYSRREYAFYPDGTYVFRTKIWLTTVKDILYVFEKGNYTVDGNQLTVIPQSGKGEWWSKKDNHTAKWGKLVKASSFKLEKTTYRFEIKYFSGSKSYALNLVSTKQTERDGGLSNEGYHYSLYEDGISNIDSPPGYPKPIKP